MAVKAYFRRKKGSIEGVLTIQYGGKKIFDRVHARSGSPVNPDDQWARGIGAIPDGIYYLWLRDPVDPGPDFPVAPGGIGKAYRISNSRRSHDTIFGPYGKVRYLVRLHFENSYPGSAGCIAVIWNKDKTLTPIPEKKIVVEHLFQYLENLSKTDEYIILDVKTIPGLSL